MMSSDMGSVPDQKIMPCTVYCSMLHTGSINIGQAIRVRLGQGGGGNDSGSGSLPALHHAFPGPSSTVCGRSLDRRKVDLPLFVSFHLHTLATMSDAADSSHRRRFQQLNDGHRLEVDLGIDDVLTVARRRKFSFLFLHSACN